MSRFGGATLGIVARAAAAGGALLLIAPVVLGADAALGTGGSIARQPAAVYGAWVLAPPIVAIVLAMILRQVVPALVVGILLAAGMLAAVDGGAWYTLPLRGLTLGVETYLLGAIAKLDHIKIIVFTLLIGGMVGIIAANGGTPAIVNSVARWASNRRRGQIVTWLAGLFVFFDDYANAMIIGPAMRPVCDRLKISRAKLAYLVDSTAAPVASIALIGTWIGAEIGFIHDGLRALSDTPGFLHDTPLNLGFAYETFLCSVPYRFYPILALVMVLLIGWLNRDFGPMLTAERAAGQEPDTAPHAAERSANTGRAWHAGVPVLVLVVVTLQLLVLTGAQRVLAESTSATGLGLVREIISGGDAYNSILYGALAAIVAAVLISLAGRRLTLAQTMDSATASMARMLPTFVVLVLAWTLSDAVQALQLGDVARDLLQRAQLDPRSLPLLVFGSACVVSFATGTSWGTMGILCPAVVQIAAGLLGDMPRAEAMPLFYGAVGSVLAGAVFGDHCSPISDTTVLSALASECSLESHVWTQMPYALVTAVVSVVCGEVLCRYSGWPAWVGLLAGSALLLVILLVFGRRSEKGF